jgi:hypothetical protein
MGGEEVLLLLVLNIGTRWGWVINITPRPSFTTGERTPGTHYIGGWVGPRVGLDAEATGKILCHCRGSNPGNPDRSQIRYWLSYPGHNISGIPTEYLREVKYMFVPFLAYFPYKGKWGLWDHQSVCLSACVPPPPNNFEPIGRFLWNSVRRSCHWRWPRRRTF